MGKPCIRATSPGLSEVVSMMTTAGCRCVDPWASACRNSTPFISGIFRASRIKVGQEVLDLLLAVRVQQVEGLCYLMATETVPVTAMRSSRRGLR